MSQTWQQPGIVAASAFIDEAAGIRSETCPAPETGSTTVTAAGPCSHDYFSWELQQLGITAAGPGSVVTAGVLRAPHETTVWIYGRTGLRPRCSTFGPSHQAW